jgi:hypothetical protein
VSEVAGLIPTGGWPDRLLFLTYTIWLVMLAQKARLSTVELMEVAVAASTNRPRAVE